MEAVFIWFCLKENGGKQSFILTVIHETTDECQGFMLFIKL